MSPLFQSALHGCRVRQPRATSFIKKSDECQLGTWPVEEEEGKTNNTLPASRQYAVYCSLNIFKEILQPNFLISLLAGPIRWLSVEKCIIIIKNTRSWFSLYKQIVWKCVNDKIFFIKLADYFLHYSFILLTSIRSRVMSLNWLFLHWQDIQVMII